MPNWFIRPGSWWLSSDSDPRWNASGRSQAITVGITPREAEAKKAELIELYGEPPNDLMISMWKD